MVTETASVTSKGQVTIPKKIREKLGIESGSEINFIIKGDEVVLLPKTDKPLEQMKELRTEIHFSEKDVQEMIRESKKVWETI